MLSLSSAAIVEKNKLASDGNWLILLEIVLTDGQEIRVCRNTDDVLWDGETWVAFPFELDDMAEMSAGEVPQLAVRLGNQTKAIQQYLESGNGGVGATVTIRVVHKPKDEDPTGSAEIEMAYVCTGCSATSEWATFTLGTGNPFRKRFPRNRVFKNICRWGFKSVQCGFVETELLPYATCNKTLSACRERQNSKRFGGFPAAGTSALYVD